MFVALIGIVVALQVACGAPAVGDLKTITLSASPSSNVSGIGGTLQLSAMGVYSTGQQRDITPRVTYTITPTGTDDMGNALPAPPSTVTLNSTGLVTAVAPFVCTWVDTTPGGTSATWAISGDYQVVASYKGISSQPVFITVASATSSTNPKGNCGP